MRIVYNVGDIVITPDGYAGVIAEIRDGRYKVVIPPTATPHGPTGPGEERILTEVQSPSLPDDFDDDDYEYSDEPGDSHPHNPDDFTPEMRAALVEEVRERARQIPVEELTPEMITFFADHGIDLNR